MLSNQTQVFKALADQLPAGVAILKLTSWQKMEFRYIYVNPCMSEMTGFDFRQYIGKNTREIFAAAYEGNTAFPKAMIAALETKREIPVDPDIYPGKKANSMNLKVICTYLEDNHVALITQALNETSSSSSELRIQNQLLEHGEQVVGLSTWMVNEKTGETHFTEGYLAVHHFDRGEVNAQNATAKSIARIHPDDQDKMEIFRTKHHKKYPASEVYRYMVDDNQYVWLQDTISQKHDDGTLMGTTQDITAIKNSENKFKEISEQLAVANDELGVANEELVKYAVNLQDAKDSQEQSENLFKNLAHNSPIGITLATVDRKLIFVNPGFAKMLGFSPEELHQIDWKTITYPEDQKENLREYEKLISGEKGVIVFDKRYIRKDGQIIWCSLVLSKMFDVVREEDVIITSIVDITQRKLTQLELEKSLDFQRKLMKTSPGIFYVYDVIEQKNIFLSDSVYGQLGYTEEEILNMGDKILSILTHPDDLGQVLEHYKKKLPNLKKNEVAQSTARYRKKQSDEYVWLESLESVFEREKDGKVRSVVGITRNITKEKESEMMIQATNKELEQLIYSVSHDLRAPSRHIESFAERIQEQESERLSEEGKNLLENVVLSTRRLGTMTDELLSYVNTRNQKAEKDIVKTHELIQDLTTIFVQTNPQQNIYWEVEELPDCYADPNLMTKLWENLISNAVKFSSTKTESRIQILAQETEKELIYSIHDNGVGFDPRFADKLFTVFQRLHKRREFPGHGIGLAIVARIIQHHGGKIWAEGVLGEGASFYFSIPK